MRKKKKKENGEIKGKLKNKQVGIGHSCQLISFMWLVFHLNVMIPSL